MTDDAETHAASVASAAEPGPGKPERRQVTTLRRQHTIPEDLSAEGEAALRRR
jgi:hypothetical protein